MGKYVIIYSSEVPTFKVYIKDNKIEVEKLTKKNGNLERYLRNREYIFDPEKDEFISIKDGDPERFLENLKNAFHGSYFYATDVKTE
jgi:hypothetical protein